MTRKSYTNSFVSVRFLKNINHQLFEKLLLTLGNGENISKTKHKKTIHLMRYKYNIKIYIIIPKIFKFLQTPYYFSSILSANGKRQTANMTMVHRYRFSFSSSLFIYALWMLNIELVYVFWNEIWLNCGKDTSYASRRYNYNEITLPLKCYNNAKPSRHKNN